MIINNCIPIVSAIIEIILREVNDLNFDAFIPIKIFFGLAILAILIIVAYCEKVNYCIIILVYFPLFYIIIYFFIELSFNKEEEDKYSDEFRNFIGFRIISDFIAIFNDIIFPIIGYIVYRKCGFSKIN